MKLPTASACLIALPATLLHLLGAVQLEAHGSSAQTQEGLQVPVGERFEADLAPGQVLEVRVPTQPGDYLVELEQRGVDAILSVRAPGHHGVITVDSPLDERGFEYLLTSPERVGELHVEISTVKPAGEPGIVSLRIVPLPADETAPGRLLAEAARTRAGAFYAARGPDNLQEAIDEYRAAAAYWQDAGDERQVMRDLYCAAVLYRLVGKAQDALDLHRRLLPIVGRVGDPQRKADLLNETGLIRLDQGELQEAQALFEAVRGLRKNLSGALRKSEAQSNLCLVHFYRSELAKGLECYETLLGQPWFAEGSTVAAAIHTNMGRARAVLGDPIRSLDHYSEALEIWRLHGDRAGVAQTLNNLALTHSELGEVEKAIRLHSEALEEFRHLGSRRWIALSLHNLGYAYLGVGEAERAIEFLSEALPLLLDTGDRRTAAATLTVMATGLLRIDKPEEARKVASQGIEIATTAQDLRRKAAALRGLAQAEHRLGEPGSALTHAREAAQLAASHGDRRALASARNLEATVALDLSDLNGATTAAEEALAIWREIDEPAGQVESMISLARAQRAAGALPRAVETALQAIGVLRGYRAEFVLPEFRSVFVASRRQAYDLAIDLLVELAATSGRTEHLEVAFAIADEGHAVGLLHAVALSDGRDLPASLQSEEQIARRELTRRLFLLATRDKKRDWSRPGSESSVAETRRQRNHLLRELELLEQRTSRRALDRAPLARATPNELQRFRRHLPAESVLLNYWLGSREGHVWVVRSSGVQHFPLPPRARLQGLVDVAVEELRSIDRRAEVPSSLQQVGNLVLGPFLDEIRDELVLVIPDGPLHRLPFAALLTDSTAEQATAPRAIVRLPSLSVLMSLRRRDAAIGHPSRWAAVFADPLFDQTDPRVSKASETLKPGSSARPAGRIDSYLPRLRYTAAEATAVSRASAAETTVLSSEDASVANLLQLNLSQYRVLHLATHALVDDEHPRLTGLVLSRWDRAGRPIEGFLDLAAIRNLRLQSDLVVLSACESGLGRAVSGEGLVGLVQAFLEAGSSSVIATLWAVDDEATAALMAQFYSRLGEGLSPPSALAAARRWMRRSHRWSSPLYWAGFVFVGDWEALGRRGGGQHLLPPGQGSLSPMPAEPPS